MNSKTYFTLLAVLFFIIGLLAYGHSLDASFQFDDRLLIIENNLIRSLNNLPWLWKYDPSRFLTHFSFAVNYHHGKLNTWGYHVVNFCLHLMVTALVFTFLSVLLAHPLFATWTEERRRGLCTFVALIFLCHPLQTQAVTYVAQRSTLLASLCYLAALILYIQSQRNHKKEFYLLAIAMAFVGIFTKPIIATLPLALVLYEIFWGEISLGSPPCGRGTVRKIILRLLPFFVLALCVPALIALWKYRMADWQHYWAMTRETAKFSRWEYLWTQFNVAMTYGRLFLLPIHQNLDYDYPIAKSFWDFPTWLSFGLLVLTVGCAAKISRKNPLVSFGIFWVFVTLSLESSLFPIGDVINEHRLYLPMVGLGIVLVEGCKKIFANERAHRIFLSCLVILWATMTYLRNDLWRDGVTFMMDVARKSPRKARVHNNLGVFYFEQQRLEEAQRSYQTAIALNPQYASPYNNLANIFIQQSRWQEARGALQRALEIEPRFAGAHYNMGNVEWLEENYEAAAENFRKAVELKPDFVYAIVALGKYHRFRNDFPRAEFHFRAALKINPDDDSAYVNLGDMYLALQDYKRALREYHRAIQRNPNLAAVYNNIGNIYDMYGLNEQAEIIYRETIARDPAFANAYFNLAHSLRKQGNVEEARLALNEALRLYRRQGNETKVARCQERLQQLGQ